MRDETWMSWCQPSVLRWREQYCGAAVGSASAVAWHEVLLLPDAWPALEVSLAKPPRPNTFSAVTAERWQCSIHHPSNVAPGQVPALNKVFHLTPAAFLHRFSLQNASFFTGFKK